MNDPKNDISKVNSWPDGLDALTAAPGHHKVVLENERVRVLETTIPPGDTVPLHTHRWPSVLYVQSFSDFIRYDHAGRVLVDSRTLPSRPERGAVLWSSPLEPHTLQNVGDADLRVLAIEIKD